jgi:uncharacterized protein YcfL
MGKLLTVPIMIFLMLCSCSGNKNINTDDEADIVLRLHDIWALTTYS